MTLVTTGGRDIAALAIAISGMLAVGPAELFFPSSAATVFGPLVWFALAGFYALSVALIALTSQPKLVIYGRTPDEIFQPLLNAAREIDVKATGDDRTLQIAMPTVGIRIRVDGQRGIDCSQVVAFEPNVSSVFWIKLLAGLRRHAAEATPVPRRGLAMLVVALLMGSLLLWQSLGKGELVVQGFRDWLWR